MDHRCRVAKFGAYWRAGCLTCTHVGYGTDWYSAMGDARAHWGEHNCRFGGTFCLVSGGCACRPREGLTGNA